MPWLDLPLHPSIILTSSASPFSFLLSLIPSLCRTSIHLFFSIPLQLLFLKPHLFTSVHFLSLFQTFPSSFLSSLFFLFFFPSSLLLSFFDSSFLSSFLSLLFFPFLF